MSNWTHVAAIVRVDRFRERLCEVDFTKVFGRELKWNSPESLWAESDEHPERFLPMGSEGSLQMSVYENPEIGHLDAYAVSVFGDLRDHDNPDQIIDWFKGKLNGLIVRSACIVAENECNGVRSWVYKPDYD